MKYVVTGTAALTVGIVVDAENQDEAFEKADEQFGGIGFSQCPSGIIRRAEVHDANEFFEESYGLDFNETCTLKEYEHDKFWKGVGKLCGRG